MALSPPAGAANPAMPVRRRRPLQGGRSAPCQHQCFAVQADPLACNIKLKRAVARDCAVAGRRERRSMPRTRASSSRGLKGLVT